MKTLKLGTKLGLAFTAIGLLVAILGALAAQQIFFLEERIEVLVKRQFPNSVNASKFMIALLDSSRHMRNLLVYDDRALVQESVDTIRRNRKLIDEQIQVLDKGVKTPSNIAQLDVVKAARVAYLPVEDAFMDLVAKGRFQEAKIALMVSVRPKQLDYQAQLTRFIDLQAENSAKGGQSAIQQATTNTAWLGAGVLATFALMAVIAWFATRAIVTPVRQALGIADAIANGNLCNNVVIDRGDELGDLLRSLDNMQANLAGLVRQIQGSANELTSASNELAATAEQVAAATNNQSEAAASMAASVEEMTVSVAHITDSAQMASDKTAHAAGLSGDGRRVVEYAGTEMAGIAEGIQRSAELVTVLQCQSKEISSIADVIKNIAEQTNLLALNAAIEAARAGEEGRGFAVVADAVRELAERTATSTAEIAGTIQKIQASTDQVFADMGRSVDRAKKGLSLSQEAGQAISELSSSTEEVMTAVREISSALKEQSQASSDIARHVESIAQMAQENSSAVDQTKDSARSLQTLASSLQGSVMRFSV
jgi:methyl-accepting chemotaxis protein